MPENDSNSVQKDAGAQHAGGSRMSEETGAVRGRISYVGAFQPQANDTRYAPHRRIGCFRPEKDSVEAGFGSCPVQIVEQSIAGVLR